MKSAFWLNGVCRAFAAVTVACLLAVSTTASAAILFSDDFTYSDGELGTASGGVWGNHSPTSGTPTDSHFIMSNTLFIDDNGNKDYSRPLADELPITSGTVYAGFNLNVSTGDPPTGISSINHYFAHFAENLSGQNTAFVSRLIMLRGSMSGVFKLGMVRGGDGGPTATYGTDLQPGTNYRVVFAYDLAGQVSTLWVDPTSVSSTNITTTSGTGLPVLGLNWFAFRNNDNLSGDKTIDNLIVATTFNEAADVSTAQPGDFDGDGDVDGADFVVWQTNFPKAEGGTLDTGDADGDGDVDGADFVVWQTNFPFTPGPGVAPVPEPAGFVLASLALPVLGLLACRKRSN